MDGDLGVGLLSEPETTDTDADLLEDDPYGILRVERSNRD
jgi:hypothetical protein